jgi:hypothetical protein
MTTIAVRDGYLAADTIVSYSTFNNGETTKIAACGEFYVALSGAGYLRFELEAWAREGCPQGAVPNLLLDNRGSFGAIFVRRDGKVFEFDNGYLMPVNAPYYAIGSGSLFAIGAMAHGASAMEAVVAASHHDKATGGQVTYVHYSALSEGSELDSAPIAAFAPIASSLPN